MEHGEEGVTGHHAGTGIAHDRSYSVPQGGLVAVYGAFSAGGLFMLEGALLEPLEGVVPQGAAIRAKFRAAMLMVAIQRNHGGYGTAFPRHAGEKDGHV